MTPRLSILIAHLNEREAFLQRLLRILTPQLTDEVEYLIEADCGEMTTGAKRNRLIRNARGAYVAHVDDDDEIATDYVPRILAATETNPDCVGIMGLYTRGYERRDPKPFIHTIQCDEWCEYDGVLWRSPNHLNPIRRELALQAGFPEITVGEDHDFSRRVQPLLKTEFFVGDPPLYFYLAETA